MTNYYIYIYVLYRRSFYTRYNFVCYVKCQGGHLIIINIGTEGEDDFKMTEFINIYKSIFTTHTIIRYNIRNSFTYPFYTRIIVYVHITHYIMLNQK